MACRAHKTLLASRFGKICKLTKRTDADKFARGLQQTKTISAAPLEHGRKYEGTALKAYGETTGSTVTASGLVICLQKSYLACSPDGIVDDCTLIEIKCPYVARDKPVTPLTVPYLELAPNGKLHLKHDHDYIMYQMQGITHITLLCDMRGCHQQHSLFGSLWLWYSRWCQSASMDMGIGYSGIVKLCQYLDMNTITHTFATNRRAITEASKVTATNILDDTAKIVRQVYVNTDLSLKDAEVIDLSISYDGCWMRSGQTSTYGIACVIETVSGLDLGLAVFSSYCQACSCARARFGFKTTIAATGIMKDQLG